MTRLRWLRWTGTNYEQAAAFLGPDRRIWATDAIRAGPNGRRYGSR